MLLAIMDGELASARNRIYFITNFLLIFPNYGKLITNPFC